MKLGFKRPNARKQVYKARTGVKDFSYKRSLLQVRKLYPIGYTNLFWNLWPLRFIFPLLNVWFWVRFSNVCCFLIMYVVLNITLMRDCNIGTRFTSGMTLHAVFVRKGNTHYLSGQTPQVDDDRDTIYIIRKIIHNRELNSKQKLISNHDHMNIIRFCLWLRQRYLLIVIIICCLGLGRS